MQYLLREKNKPKKTACMPALKNFPIVRGNQQSILHGLMKGGVDGLAIFIDIQLLYFLIRTIHVRCNSL